MDDVGSCSGSAMLRDKMGCTDTSHAVETTWISAGSEGTCGVRKEVSSTGGSSGRRRKEGKEVAVREADLRIRSCGAEGGIWLRLLRIVASHASRRRKPSRRSGNTHVKETDSRLSFFCLPRSRGRKGKVRRSDRVHRNLHFLHTTYIYKHGPTTKRG
jgi:hypothetical protein